MNDMWKLVIALSIISACSYAQSANEGFIMESEGRRHLIDHPDPLYPPIAKAAHIQGTVLLHISVNEKGLVTKVEAIGGPPMLTGAAVEAVQHWTYKPFQKDGKAIAVQVVASIPFSLGIPAAEEKSDEAISQSYTPKADECRAADASAHWADALKSCGELVTIADRFPNQSLRANEIRLAHQDFGEALAFFGDMSGALLQFHQDVAIAEKSLTPVDVEYGTAYYWLAFAEHALHMPTEAERDYSTSEASMRKAIENLPAMKNIYSKYLAHTLAFHSVLVEQAGDVERSKKMREEAVSLDPHALDGLKGAQ